MTRNSLTVAQVFQVVQWMKDHMELLAHQTVPAVLHILETTAEFPFQLPKTKGSIAYYMDMAGVPRRHKPIPAPKPAPEEQPTPAYVNILFDNDARLAQMIADLATAVTALAARVDRMEQHDLH